MNRRLRRNQIVPVCGALLCLLMLAGILRGEDRAQAAIAKARFTGLLDLRDDQGKSYGYGAAFARYLDGPLQNGRVLYAWFGLLQDPGLAEPLLHDLLDFAADRAARK